CLVRSYLSSNCDPSASSLAGLLITVGTCFYIDEGVSLGSWRADCAGVDYTYTTGLDKSNSYSNSSNAAPAVQSILRTATGVVTVTPASSYSSTASPAAASSTDA
ncbi:hypothetical protein A1O3_04255, partial [Capronia epimyces CBS 606.96]